MQKNKHISLLIPLFNEQESLGRLLQQLESFSSITEHDIDVFFVDDGSTDKTWSMVQLYKPQSFRISGLRFARNFGKELALMAGIEKIQGDAVVIMDADLQHPLDMVHSFLEVWEKENFLIVEGVKASRGNEFWLYKAASVFFYQILRRWSGLDLSQSSDFKLLDRRVVELLKQFPERNLLFRGLTTWLGIKRAQVPFAVQDRSAGKPSMNVSSRVLLAKTSITAFSAKPLQIVFRIASLFIIGSAILAVHTIYKKWTGQAIEGFTTIIILQLIIGGVTLFSLGTIGEYMSQIYEEVKGRPRYVVIDELSHKLNPESDLMPQATIVTPSITETLTTPEI